MTIYHGQHAVETDNGAWRVNRERTDSTTTNGFTCRDNEITRWWVGAPLQVGAEYDDPVIAALQTFGERL